MRRHAGQRRKVCAANAYIPGVLRLNHCASTYLPADIYHRLSSVFGETSQFITGVDVYGRLAGRELRHLTDNERESYILNYLHAFQAELAALSIEPSNISRTDDFRMTELSEFAFDRLLATELIFEKDSIEYRCERCEESLSKSDILVYDETGAPERLRSRPDLESATTSLHCGLCRKGNVQVKTCANFHLHLPRTKGLLSMQAAHDEFPCSRLLTDIWNGSFRDWGFTRTNYYGSSIKRLGDRAFYLWWDSLLSKLLSADISSNEAASAAKEELFVCFFGKNVFQYYALVLPTILSSAFDVDPHSLQLSPRGFSFCGDDLSDDIGTVLRTRNGDDVRFYLAYTAPDGPKDFNLTLEGVSRTCDAVLDGAFGRFISTAANFARPIGTKDVSAPPPANVISWYRRLRDCYDSAATRRLLMDLEQYARQEERELRQGETADYNLQARAFWGTMLVSQILSCYVPRWMRSRFSYDSKLFSWAGEQLVQFGRIDP